MKHVRKLFMKHIFFVTLLPVNLLVRKLFIKHMLVITLLSVNLLVRKLFMKHIVSPHGKLSCNFLFSS